MTQPHPPHSACLLLHGFCGTPFEIQPLADHLTGLGIHVDAPLLPGHGTTVAHLKNTLFNDWMDFAVQRYFELSKRFYHVLVGGFSMGGAMALMLAARYQPAAVFALAAPAAVYRIFPWQMRDWRLIFLPVLRFLTPYVPYQTAGPASRKLVPIKGYEGILCLPQLYSMDKAYTQLRRELDQVTCPALIMHALNDRLVPSEHALLYAKGIKSAQRRLEYVHIDERVTSHHHIIVHPYCGEYVCKQVGDFIQNVPEVKDTVRR